jgi:hypothetical protein
MPLWANSSEPSLANSVTCPEALARIMEWDFLIPNRSVEVHRTLSPSLAFIEVGDIITTELRLLMSLVRSSVLTCLLTLHRNGMHPTRELATGSPQNGMGTGNKKS